jgi:cation:H+ antiporter
MEAWVHDWLDDRSWLMILSVLAVAIAALGKSADWLVAQATELSLRAGVPRLVVGATILSLGTTTPEAAVSVLAAWRGAPDLALGNAVGSVICDTGLILGLAGLIGVLPIERRLISRQAWIQLAAGCLLVLASINWLDPTSILEHGSRLTQWWGWIFVCLLAVYLTWSIVSARKQTSGHPIELPDVEGLESGEIEAGGLKPQGGGHEPVPDVKLRRAARPGRIAMLLFGMLLAIAAVVVSAQVLIGAATVTAERVGVPKSVIAATLVALGTSLPELVVAITSVLRKQGELALGNVIGADILNVLFVAGAAAALTPGGLAVTPEFFRLQYPAMLTILVIFRGILLLNRGNTFPRSGSALLLLLYLLYLGLAFFNG